MTKTAVILVVGLNRAMLAHAPRLSAFARAGQVRTLSPVWPAVTCSVQSSMLTGLTPAQHGIVGNGWYNREQAEIQFWKQSNHLVQGEKVWETARRRDASATCLNMFWWYNMYSSADWSLTPRPQYKADGRKIPDCYSEPADLRDQLQAELGPFPLFHFWGPGASIKSSAWIAEATRIVHHQKQPTLTLVYLPHLDYALQKYGPGHETIPQHVAQIDAVAGDLIDYFHGAGVRPMIVSEYGITAVNGAVTINRALRQAGLLRVRREGEGELLDAGASDAFAVADHQTAHVYVKDANKIANVTEVCGQMPEVDAVLDRAEQARIGLDHARAGELLLIAQRDRWFSYEYWLDARHAPDFARTVEIHRKPGYDPLELFIDPTIRFPKLAIGWRLAKKTLGQRILMDLIPLDTALVRGSHGRADGPADEQPLLITEQDLGDRAETLPCTAIRDVMLEHLFAGK